MSHPVSPPGEVPPFSLQRAPILSGSPCEIAGKLGEGAPVQTVITQADYSVGTMKTIFSKMIIH